MLIHLITLGTSDPTAANEGTTDMVKFQETGLVLIL
jgi:hypothetical protein